MKTLPSTRSAVTSATLVRAACSASSWVHETLGEQFGLEPISAGLDVDAGYGAQIEAWSIVSEGASPLGALAESPRSRISSAGCLAVEVRSDDTVLVLGSAWMDPMGTCIYAETCIQFDGVSRVEADALESEFFPAVGDARFERLSLGSTTIFRRWDDLLGGEGIAQRLEHDQDLIAQLREAGHCFRASFPRVPAGWEHVAGLRGATVERIDFRAPDAMVSAGADHGTWLGDADPLQVTFNIDGIGDRSMLMTARTCIGITCPTMAAQDADLDGEFEDDSAFCEAA
jgi:hypothetical protein